MNYAVTGTGSNPAMADDFVSGEFPSGTVTFGDGDTTESITIPVMGDTLFEPNDEFTVTLSDPSDGAMITIMRDSGVIENDDPLTGSTIEIEPGGAVGNEGDAGATPFTFVVSRGNVTTGAATVDYVVSGTGSNPADAEDFVGGELPVGWISFAPNQISQTITIDVSGDTAFEANEGFRVTLVNPAGDSVITSGSSDAVIGNDDAGTAPTLSISASSAAQTEGDSGSNTFTLHRQPHWCHRC